MEEDEYDEHDFLADFTEEDFARIDHAIQAHFTKAESTNTEQGGPKIIVQLEQPVVDDAVHFKATVASNAMVTGPAQRERSPLQQFRRNGILSVTDLVAPAWCEVQFDYGLRQFRFRKLKDRPPSFISGAGKKIIVEKNVAAQNDRRSTKGKIVHKKLEREIRPVEIRVDVTRDEERWALRLVNMLASVDCLMTLGCAREIPVFGFVNDHVVVGIIDELLREPPRPQESTLTHKESNYTQTHSTPTSEQPELILSQPHTLHLRDTKTRHLNSLPQHDDTLSSRLQLMLYHRLLTPLISPTNSFDFASLWTRLKLDPTVPFSPRFMSQAQLTWDSPQMGPQACLDDLTRIWGEAVKRLNVHGVERSLKLVYRKRGGKGKRKQKTAALDSGKEEEDLERAIAASLMDSVGIEDGELARAIAGLSPSGDPRYSSASDTESPAESQDSDLESLVEPEGVPEGDSAGTREVSNDGANGTTHLSSSVSAPKSKRRRTKSDHNSHSIIGTKRFLLDDGLLDNYLAGVWDWWSGRRAPRGVTVTHSKRCFTCEYYEGCEWREVKANEFTEKHRTKHENGEDSQYTT